MKAAHKVGRIFLLSIACISATITAGEVTIKDVKTSYTIEEFNLRAQVNLAMLVNADAAEMLHGQVLMLGEKKFGDPEQGIQYSFLRSDPIKPTCDPNQTVEQIITVQLDEDKFNSVIPMDMKPSTLITSARIAYDKCQFQHTFYKKLMNAITPEVKEYRKFDQTVFKWRMETQRQKKR